ncbi:MAG: hypothetical protein M1813_003171 [Trichoglossum hirsutum]|nr:MAG: hypothetical protein M1813_003171 [Trichoglossum hirsutum]
MQTAFPNRESPLPDPESIYLDITTSQSPQPEDLSSKLQELLPVSKGSGFRLEKFSVQLAKYAADTEQTASPLPRISNTASLLKAVASLYGQNQSQPQPSTDAKQATPQVHFRPMRLAGADSWFYSDPRTLASTSDSPCRLDTLELAFHQPFTNSAADFWLSFCDRLRSQPGCQTVYWGFQEEDNHAVSVLMRMSRLVLIKTRYVSDTSLAWLDSSSAENFHNSSTKDEVFSIFSGRLSQPPKVSSTPVGLLEIQWFDKSLVEILDSRTICKTAIGEHSFTISTNFRGQAPYGTFGIPARANNRRTMFEPNPHADEDSVASPSRLLWLDRGSLGAGSDTACVVLITWGGPAERQQWLNNFVGHDYTILGHTAHVLGLACPSAQSKHVFLRETPSQGMSTEEPDIDLGF